MSQALKRIEKEFKYFNEDVCEAGYTAGPIDESDMYLWKATFKGPENSPYEGGIFTVRIDFPKDYPFKPPKIIFKTKVYHPNISSQTGYFSLNLLIDEWSPDTKLIDIFKAIQTLLIEPNNHVCEPQVYEQYLTDKDRFEAIAKEWTEKYTDEIE